MKYPSTCKHCGGRMAIEYFGQYGDTFMINKDGSVGKKRIRRTMYEHLGEDDSLLFCEQCGKVVDPKDECE